MLLSNCALNSTYTENYFSSTVQTEKMHFLMKIVSFSLMFLQDNYAMLIPMLTSETCNSITSQLLY